MKILNVLSAFTPHAYGGGEISATNLAKWLAKQGHEVAVLTAADKNEPEMHGEMFEGLRVWRLRFPRAYTFWNHVHASKWLKPWWYLQDHFDPRNRSRMARVLDEFKPDVVQVHVITGMGYNSLKEVAKRNIPTVYVMHDLNLACLWGGMFKNGKTCAEQCFKCKCVSKVRWSSVNSIPTLAFCSPSLANLEKGASVLPLKKHKTAAILNANIYPQPTVSKPKAGHMRFLYVGRMHNTKGIDLLLEVLEDLAQTYPLSIDLLGTGPDEQALKDRFSKHSWCTFKGHVSQQDVSNAMASSDMLCTPSIWLENSPGVVIHALSQGLPVLGSDVGGIPELIEHGKNGLLISPGDKTAWKNAIEDILKNPSKLKAWSTFAKTDAVRFSQETNGKKMLALLEELVADGKKAVKKL